MSKYSRKIFQQQMANMKPSVTPCPVCGCLIDDRKSTALGVGETIVVKTRYGTKNIPRYQAASFHPCGCTWTFDRLEQRVVEQKKGKSA